MSSKCNAFYLLFCYNYIVTERRLLAAQTANNWPWESWNNTSRKLFQIEFFNQILLLFSEWCRGFLGEWCGSKCNLDILWNNVSRSATHELPLLQCTYKLSLKNIQRRSYWFVNSKNPAINHCMFWSNCHQIPTCPQKI